MYLLLLTIIYMAFISLGLPDSLLGSAWPVMYEELNVSMSYAGIITMIISGGTIVTSLLSGRLTRKLGTGLVTALSVMLTAVALFGFSVSNSFILLCLWAIPYGIGAGAVRCCFKQLCCPTLFFPTYELAPLFLGSGSHYQSFYYEL